MTEPTQETQPNTETPPDVETPPDSAAATTDEVREAVQQGVAEGIAAAVPAVRAAVKEGVESAAPVATKVDLGGEGPALGMPPRMLDAWAAGADAFRAKAQGMADAKDGVEAAGADVVVAKDMQTQAEQRQTVAQATLDRATEEAVDAAEAQVGVLYRFIAKHRPASTVLPDGFTVN